MKKIPDINYPRILEAEFTVKLRKNIRHIFQNTTQYILPEIQKIKQRAKDDIKLDYYANDIETLVDKVETINTVDPYELLISQAQLIENNNKKQLNRQLLIALGISLALRERYLPAVRESFVNRNISLINSIPIEYHRKLKAIILEGIDLGHPTSLIAKRIRKLYKITEGRATLIAVDQVGKYFGELTKVRSLAMGVKKFIWITAKDERVRDSHRGREGKLYAWKKGADGSFPGSEIRCRCVARNVYS